MQEMNGTPKYVPVANTPPLSQPINLSHHSRRGQLHSQTQEQGLMLGSSARGKDSFPYEGSKGLQLRKAKELLKGLRVREGASRNLVISKTERLLCKPELRVTQEVKVAKVAKPEVDKGQSTKTKTTSELNSHQEPLLAVPSQPTQLRNIFAKPPFLQHYLRTSPLFTRTLPHPQP